MRGAACATAYLGYTDKPAAPLKPDGFRPRRGCGY
jgi:hypothetical protein